MVEELVKVLGSGGSIGGADLSSCLAELPLSVELRAALTDAQRTLVGAIDAEMAAVSGEIAGMASGASSGGDGEVVALLLRLKVLRAIADCEADALSLLDRPFGEAATYCGGQAPPTPVVAAAVAEAAAAAPPAKEEAADEPYVVPTKLKGAVKAKVVKTEAVVPYSEGSSSIHHIVVEFAGDEANRMPYWEGQCVSVLPPGDDPKTGKPHKKRRPYTIASERRGDDLAGNSLSLCVRWVPAPTGAGPADVPDGAASTWLKSLAVGDELEMEGPTGKSMVLPEDLSKGLVLVATSTGSSTFRGFLHRLLKSDNAQSRAFRASGAQVLVLMGGLNADAIPYAGEFLELAKAEPQLSVELALGGGRVDAGGETTLPDAVAAAAPRIKAIADNGGDIFLGGLKGMVKPVEKALTDAIGTPVKDLKKAGKYHSEVY